MNTINISKKRLNSLEPLELSKNVFNTEGAVYNMNYRGDNKVLKVLYNSNGVLFANKLYTVEMLNYYKNYLPESFLCPDNLVSISGEVAGFTTPKFDGVNFADLLKSKEIEIKEKVYYLIKIGETLKQLKNIREYSPLKSIYINDLHEANILVNHNNKELKFLDLDSCKILNNCSFASRFLSPKHFINDKPHKYLYNELENGNGYIVANENSDLFCYMTIIMNFLYGENITTMTMDEFYNYLNYLSDIGFNKDLLHCFEKMVLKCDNSNPVNYLETLTENQVCRAKKLVYNYNIKK